MGGSIGIGINMSKKRTNVAIMLIVLITSPAYLLYGAQEAKPEAVFKGIGTFNKEKQIILGTTAPISGSLYKLGNDFTKGMGIVFNEVNRQNGVHGHAIKLIVLDDEYERSEMKKNIDALQKKTSILFGTFGSDVLDAIPQNKLDDLLVLLPDAGVSYFRKPEYTGMVFFRPSTGEEVTALLGYLIHKLFKRKIAIFYENSLWGKDGRDIAKKYIESYKNINAECVADASYVRNTVNVNKAVDQISKESPEAVICIAHYRPTYSFIRGMLNKGTQQTTFFGVSETALMQDYLKQSRGITLVTSSVVPNPWNSKMPIVQQYRTAMKRYLPNYKLSIMSLEGYIKARLFVESLKKTKPPITKYKIVDALSNWKNANFFGLRLNFNPATRALSKAVWLNESRRVRWVKIGVEGEE